MAKKYLLLPVVAGAVSLLTVDASWALTAYVISGSQDDAFAIDPSTIQDGAPGHRTADVYDIQSDYYVHIGKMEFDCSGRHVQTLSEKVYVAEKNGLDFKNDLGALGPTDFSQGSVLEGLFTFVCGWPQVSSNAVRFDPDPPDLQTLVIDFSGEIMDENFGSDSK